MKKDRTVLFCFPESLLPDRFHTLHTPIIFYLCAYTQLFIYCEAHNQVLPADVDKT